MAAYENFSRSFRHGSIAISDGTGTPKTCTVVTDEGDVSWSVPKEVAQVIQRGNVAGTGSHPIQGDFLPCPFSFTARVSRLYTTTSFYTPYDIITDHGGGFESVGSTGEVYMTSIVFTITDPTGGITSETITFAKCFPEGSVDFSEGDPNTISFSLLDWEQKPTIATTGP